jgi:hypothetical protein
LLGASVLRCALDGSAELVDDVVELLQLCVEEFNTVVSKVLSGNREGIDQFFSGFLGNL